MTASPVTSPPRYPVAGIDEVGRGPLAGPVVAAAVVLDPARPIAGLADSKALDRTRREALAVTIRERAVAVSVAVASVAEIDRLNILQASLLAMRRAVATLTTELDSPPMLCLVDGNRDPQLALPTATIVKGDSRVRSIAAASIVAKVARDAFMCRLHERHPEYGFDRHVGYPTAEHRAALRAVGVTDWHRRSFAPVRMLLDGHDTVTSANAELPAL